MTNDQQHPGGGNIPQSVMGIFERIARDAEASSTLRMFRSRLLQALEREIGSDTASLMDAPPDRRMSIEASVTRAGFYGVSVQVRLLPHYLRERARLDASNARFLQAMRSGPAVDTDIYSAKERDRLALYTEILRPQGARSVLASIVACRGRTVAQLVLKRHGATPFRTRDARRLGALLPALALADAGYQYAATAAAVATGPKAGLSAREREVAELVSKGFTNREIASLFGRSSETVKKQVRNVLEKVGVSNRTELAAVWVSSADSD